MRSTMTQRYHRQHSAWLNSARQHSAWLNAVRQHSAWLNAVTDSTQLDSTLWDSVLSLTPRCTGQHSALLRAFYRFHYSNPLTVLQEIQKSRMCSVKKRSKEAKIHHGVDKKNISPTFWVEGMLLAANTIIASDLIIKWSTTCLSLYCTYRNAISRLI